MKNEATPSALRSVDEIDWERWEPGIRATLLFIITDGRILLIRKLTGLGKGNINGPGGKLEPGESAREAAIREVEEEVGVTAHDPQEMGVLHFQFTDGLKLHCVVFRSPGFEGELIETREAIPLWFPLDAIPYEEMWADDALWLPGMIEGHNFTGYFVFEERAMLSQRVEWE
ncbi:MAG: 8-oxo-dGTP diphosphatase [Verrucomicrobiales bacterium]